MTSASDTPLTIDTALRLGASSLGAVADQPRLEAQVLLAAALQVEKTWLFAHPEAQLEPEAAAHFLAQLSRRANGDPLPYVLGWWEFFGRRFRVTPEVLIPRPETEGLVERALVWMRRWPAAARVLDSGTGSGCIAISIAAEAPGCRVVACDLSLAALRVARSNAERHGVAARVDLVRADLALGLAAEFDLVCANLPYLPAVELQHWEASRWEPRSALDGGPDGLSVISRLLLLLPHLLAAQGVALLEIGAGQSQAVLERMRSSLPGWMAEVNADLAGVPRVIELRRGQA